MLTTKFAIANGIPCLENRIVSSTIYSWVRRPERLALTDRNLYNRQKYGT